MCFHEFFLEKCKQILKCVFTSFFLREAEIEELRKLFSTALEQLAQVAGDPECKIARYWASGM